MPPVVLARAAGHGLRRIGVGNGASMAERLIPVDDTQEERLLFGSLGRNVRAIRERGANESDYKFFRERS